METLQGIESLPAVGGQSLAVLVVAFVITTWLTRLQRELRGRGPKVDTIVAWLPLVQIVTWVLAALFAGVTVLRAPLSVALFLLVPATVLIVVAARDVVRHAFAGAVLAFEHSILAGDVIVVATPREDVDGQVIAIGLRRTLIRRPDESEVLIPNETLLNSIVSTNKGHERDSAVEVELPLSESFTTEEFPRVQRLAVSAASVSRFASPHRRPEVFLESGGPGGLRLRVRAFAFSPEYRRHLETDVVAMFNDAQRG